MATQARIDPDRENADRPDAGYAFVAGVATLLAPAVVLLLARVVTTPPDDATWILVALPFATSTAGFVAAFGFGLE